MSIYKSELLENNNDLNKILDKVNNLPVADDLVDEITYSDTIKAIAADQIQIGDTVYTLDKSGQKLGAGTYFAPLNGRVNVAKFSHNGKILVIGGWFEGSAKIYSVEGNTLTFIDNLYQDNNGTLANDQPRAIEFSPNDKVLLVGGETTTGGGFVRMYSLVDTEATYIKNIYADNNNTAFNATIQTISISPDASMLVIGGNFTGYAKRYSINGTSTSYVSDIFADNNGNSLTTYTYDSAFSPDGSILILCGRFELRMKIYEIVNGGLIYCGIIAGEDGTAVKDAAHRMTFSPDGKLFVVGGYFAGYAKAYSVSGINFTFIKNIYSNTGTTLLGSHPEAVEFSPDGKTLLISGDFNEKVKRYSVNGTTITYLGGVSTFDDVVYTASFAPSGDLAVLGGAFTDYGKTYDVNDSTFNYIDNIPSNDGKAVFDNDVCAAAFSPDNTLLALGGNFSGKAKLYSVDGNEISFIDNIYADGSGSSLDGGVLSMAFSPNGDMLVIGGNFTNKLKKYSVNGNSVSYLSNIYADNNSTVLNGAVNTITFSPSGNAMVIGGAFSGYAKVYSVSGISTPYISNIFANSGSTALSGVVYSADFSPSGSLLALGGNFSGKAKVYSVNGTSITYLKDLYANSGTTALSDYVCAVSFSTDGALLAIGGKFSGYGKLYSVSGSNVSYNSDICTDAYGSALNGEVYTLDFSPNGKSFAISGGFNGHCKSFAVENNSLVHNATIYDLDGANILNMYAEVVKFSPNADLLVVGGIFTDSNRVYQTAEVGVFYDKAACLVPEGDFTEFPYGSKLGFAKTGGEAGQQITVRTIGDVAVDVEIEPQLDTQDDLIAQIGEALQGKAMADTPKGLVTGLYAKSSTSQSMTIPELINKENIMIIYTGGSVADSTHFIGLGKIGNEVVTFSQEGYYSYYNGDYNFWDATTGTITTGYEKLAAGNWQYIAW